MPILLHSSSAFDWAYHCIYVFIYSFFYTCRILPDLSLGVRALLAVCQDSHRAAVFRAAWPTAGAHVCLVTHTLTRTHAHYSNKEVAMITVDLFCGFADFFFSHQVFPLSHFYWRYLKTNEITCLPRLLFIHTWHGISWRHVLKCACGVWMRSYIFIHMEYNVTLVII